MSKFIASVIALMLMAPLAQAQAPIFGSTTGNRPQTQHPKPAVTKPATNSPPANAPTSNAPAAAAATVQAQSYELRSAIGTNLDEINYNTLETPFVDVMKSAGPWISGDSATWDNGLKLDLDANGWVRSLQPGQIAHTLMLREIGNHFPAGQYLVRYKGKGNLKFEYAARILSQKPGEITLQVTPQDGGIHLSIQSTDPSDYLRDFQITMPGGICEGNPFTQTASAQDCGGRRFLSHADNSKTTIFYPVFLERLRAYSVLRFINWMKTNNNPLSQWSQRPLLENATWSGPHGAPIEVMIELANRVNAHPWFTIQHLTDETYARNFAQLTKAKLNSSLRVYVEDSNEIWNWIFKQRPDLAKKAKEQIPPIDEIQYHALRTRTLGGIFKEALGATRVVTTLGIQAGNPGGTGAPGLEFLRTRFGKDLGIDALAVAPYFPVVTGPAQASTYTSMSLDQLFAYVRTTVMPGVLSAMRANQNLARSYGLKLIAYEGGQHLVGIQGAENDAQLTALFIAFNRDPRIKQIYLDYLAGWKQTGGELFVHYHDAGRYSKWGSWGALEYIDQPRTAAPKFDALHTFIEQNPVWWPQ